MPVCFHKPLASEMGIYTNSYLLLAILGSMTQYEGVSQGLIFDPSSMQSLVCGNGTRVNCYVARSWTILSTGEHLVSHSPASACLHSMMAVCHVGVCTGLPTTVMTFESDAHSCSPLAGLSRRCVKLLLLLLLLLLMIMQELFTTLPAVGLASYGEGASHLPSVGAAPA